MHAARNIRLCTKDCICLYICPTGATDTENGQIDFSKCIDGCRLCVDACPSHAIYLVHDNYPPQQEKSELIKEALLALAESKTQQEKVALSVSKSADSPEVQQLAKAISVSNRIVAEDCFRESGFMLPGSKEVKTLLQSLLNSTNQEDFPRKEVERLLELLNE